MSKTKYRKATPQPPHYFWLDADGCWDCNCNHNGCRGCKRLKEQRAYERERQKRKDKKELRTKNYETD